LFGNTRHRFKKATPSAFDQRQRKLLGWLLHQPQVRQSPMVYQAGNSRSIRQEYPQQHQLEIKVFFVSFMVWRLNENYFTIKL